MNHATIARDLITEQLLREAFGHGAPVALQQRIVEQLSLQRPQDHTGSDLQLPRAPRSRWLFAAALLGGVAVVFATARATALLPDGRAQDPQRTTPSELQDPPVGPPADAATSTPIKLTDQDVQAQRSRRQSLPPETAARRAQQLVGRHFRAVVVTERVTGASNIVLDQLTEHEAAARLAEEHGVGVLEYGAALVIGSVPTRSLPYYRRVTLRTKDCSMTSFCKQLHARCGVSICVPSAVAARITCDVTDAPWRALLEAAASACKLEVVGCGAVMALRPPRDATTGSDSWVIMSRDQEGLAEHRLGPREVLDHLAQVADVRSVVDPAVGGDIAMTAREMPMADLLPAIATACGADAMLSSRGVWHFAPAAEPPTTSLTHEQLSLAQLVEHASRLLPASSAQLSATAAAKQCGVALFAGRAPIVDVLAAVTLATGRTLSRDDDGSYIIQ